MSDHEQRQQLRDHLMNNDDVEEALLDVRSVLPDLHGRREITVSQHKLRYGLRREILAALAEEANDLLERPITDRMVERCLKEYRATVARLPKSDV